MFDDLVVLLVAHAAQAPWIIFLMICATGLCLPVSEDLVILGSGWIAASILPDQAAVLFLAGLAGAYASDWMTYGIGRGLGGGLARLTRRRVERGQARVIRMQPFFQRYGIWALLFGRLVPFGFRTGLFLAAGISRVHVWRFAWADALGCLLTHSLLFGTAFFGHQHVEEIVRGMRGLHWVLLGSALVLGGVAIWRLRGARPAVIEPQED